MTGSACFENLEKPSGIHHIVAVLRDFIFIDWINEHEPQEERALHSKRRTIQTNSASEQIPRNTTLETDS